MSENRRWTPERRAAPRRRLAARISVAGTQAWLIDQSATGVAFETEQRFTPGDEVLLVLPLAYETANLNLRATCTGRIVRVERRGALYKVAGAYQLTFRAARRP